MGSQKTSESTSYSGSAQQWAQPFAKAGANSIEGAFNRYQPYTDRALASTEQLGNKLGAQYDTGAGISAQAQQYNSDVLNGNYMNGNPYMAGMLQQMRGDVANGVNSQFTLGGRYGSGAHTGALAKEMANAENQMLYNNYGQEMARRDNAMQAAYGQGNAQAGLALGAQNQAMTSPYAGMSAYGSALGNLFSGGTQKSVSYGPNPIWGAIGAGMGALGTAAAGGAFSDRRLKRDIKPLGTNEKGLTVYNWIYKNDPTATVQIGFMADEIRDAEAAGILPKGAFIPNYQGSGYDGVNMALCGSTKVVETA